MQAYTLEHFYCIVTAKYCLDLYVYLANSHNMPQQGNFLC